MKGTFKLEVHLVIVLSLLKMHFFKSLESTAYLFFLEIKQKIFCHIVKIVESKKVVKKRRPNSQYSTVQCKLLCQCPFHGSIVGVFSIKFALLVRYCLVIVMFSTIALGEASCFFHWNYDRNSNRNFWRILWPSALISEIRDVIKKAVDSRIIQEFRLKKQSTSPFVSCKK